MNDWQIGMLALRGEPFKIKRNDVPDLPEPLTAVQDAIQELGSPTVAQIAAHLEIAKERAQSLVSKLRAIDPRIKRSHNSAQTYVYWLE